MSDADKAPARDKKTAKDATPAAAQEVVPTHIVVQALRDGHRRCGRVWTTRPTMLPLDLFDEEEIGRLFADPALVVAFGVDEDEGAG